ncbi:DUF2975 domain-containing protein [Niallia taxi]|uniref:DUF2975 domain-containing protein n=1 Tax=Niallia taxi TaxID=2499688 RepID=A0A3S2W239_9BACI|nr:DUF2975 domain-containing protein [Niallia taxi]
MVLKNICTIVIPVLYFLYQNITLYEISRSKLLYGATVPFYFALYQAFNLLYYIDKSKVFSELSVKGLKH